MRIPFKYNIIILNLYGLLLLPQMMMVISDATKSINTTGTFTLNYMIVLSQTYEAVDFLNKMFSPR